MPPRVAFGQDELRAVENLFHHSIDLSAVAGLNDDAVVTGLAPGESQSVTFQATNPGLYVYGSVSADLAEHGAHGMVGLILVEPAAGLSLVDKEFYVMQAEFYVSGALGQTGLRTFDADGMMTILSSAAIRRRT
jgi:nitrite reductase (NO-forming)